MGMRLAVGYKILVLIGLSCHRTIIKVIIQVDDFCSITKCFYLVVADISLHVKLAKLFSNEYMILLYSEQVDETSVKGHCQGNPPLTVILQVNNATQHILTQVCFFIYFNFILHFTSDFLIVNESLSLRLAISHYIIFQCHHTDFVVHPYVILKYNQLPKVGMLISSGDVIL